MSEWFLEKKREFYWWLEEAPIPAKAGAILVSGLALAFLLLAPFFFLGLVVIFFVCWLLFALLESFG